MPPKVNLALLLANLVGAIIYVFVASHSWAIPQEHGLHPTTGEPFVWALYVLPIWALFSTLDLIWGVVIASRKQWRNGRFWLAAACIWVIAVTIDFAHH
jgi:hypothetical protein